MFPTGFDAVIQQRDVNGEADPVDLIQVNFGPTSAFFIFLSNGINSDVSADNARLREDQ